MALSAVQRNMYLYLSLSCLQARALAAFSWINPEAMGKAGDYSENQPWPLGSIQTLKWSGELANASLIAWQDVPSTFAPSYNVIADPGGVKAYSTSYNWTVNSGTLSLSDTPVFWINIYDNEGSIWQSHYVNITTPTSTSTSSTSTKAPTTTSSTITSTDSEASIQSILATGIPSTAAQDLSAQCFLHNTLFGPHFTTPSWYIALPTAAQSYLSSEFATNTVACTGTPASTSATVSPSSKGLSTGAQAGIGAGVGLAGLLSILGVSLFFVRKRRATRAPRQDLIPIQDYQDHRKEMAASEGVLHEMGDNELRRHELSEQK